MTHSEQLQVARRIKSAWTMGGVANTVTDYLPFVGAAKDIGRGVGSLAQGKWGQGLGQLGMGVGFGALDFATAGLASSAIRGVGKLGLRGAMSAGAHAAGQAGVKGIAQGVGTAAMKSAPWSAGYGALSLAANSFPQAFQPEQIAQPPQVQQPPRWFQQAPQPQMANGMIQSPGGQWSLDPSQFPTAPWNNQ